MYMCGVWQRLLWNNSMCSIMKSLQKKRTWTRKAYFLKQCIRDSWFHKNPVFSGKRTWALNSFIKRDWEFMSRNRVSHLHLGLPSILENVYISLRHFSIAEKFSFSPSLLDFFFFMLWSVNRMHAIQHLSTCLTSSFSGVSHAFIIIDTSLTWEKQTKEPRGGRLRTLLKARRGWASDSPNSLLNSFKKPCNSGLRPKREYSIPSQYTVIQCWVLMLLSEWGSHDIYLPWFTKKIIKAPVCKHFEDSLGCKPAVH